MIHLVLALGMLATPAPVTALTVTVLTVPAPLVEPMTRADDDQDTIRMLLDEVNRLQTLVDVMHDELAQARIGATTAHRELEELRQFIADHHELGQDFKSYRAVKAVAEEQARREVAEAARQRRDQEKVERQQRQQEAKSRRAAEKAETDRLRDYERRGFSPIGQDVFAGKMGYSYGTNDATVARVDWQPAWGRRWGRGVRMYPGVQVDFSSMTISGAVLNASNEVRNVGVAIAFFDVQGNQVGHSMVQVNNARPDVPYPFTETISMALNGPFASSTRYVLYSDPIE